MNETNESVHETWHAHPLVTLNYLLPILNQFRKETAIYYVFWKPPTT